MPSATEFGELERYVPPVAIPKVKAKALMKRPASYDSPPAKKPKVEDNGSAEHGASDDDGNSEKCGPEDDSGFVVNADPSIGGEEVPDAGVQDAGVDVQDTGGEEAPGTDGCKLRIANGHHLDVCIFAHGKGKDKAQILNISPKQCHNTKWTPRTACKHIKEEMNSLMKDITLPIQGSPQAGILRQHAKDARYRLLSC